MGAIEKKPVEPTMAISTSQQEARARVRGKDDYPRIVPGSFGGQVKTDRRRKNAPIQLKFTTDDMLLLAQMHRAVVAMFEIMKRLPPAMRRGCLSQLGRLTSSGTEKCDDPPPPPGKAITMPEITLMEACYEALMLQWRAHEQNAKLVVGRAIGMDWKVLVQRDGRSRSMCSYARNDCLYRMAQSDYGSVALDVLDKIALDTLDRISA